MDTPRIRVTLLLVLSLVIATPNAFRTLFAEEASQISRISFTRDVAPVLVEQCQACHGVKTAESSYRLDSYEHLRQPGDYELAPVTPGSADESELFRLISSDDDDERMPRGRPRLLAHQIALVREWIEQGAEFDGPDAATPLVRLIPRRPHPEPPQTYPAAMPITALTFHPDGQSLIVGGYHELTVWDTNTGDLLQRVGNIAQRTYVLEFNQDGSLLAVGGGSPGRMGELKLIDPSNWAEVLLLETTSDVVLDLAFDPSSRRLAAAGADGKIRIYEIPSGKLLHTIGCHADWVTAVDWSQDGTRLVSSSRDATAKISDADTGRLLANYTGHDKGVDSVVFHPDGNRVFSGARENNIHHWDMTGELFTPTGFDKKGDVISGFGGAVYQLRIAGEHLFSVSADRSARQHNLEDRELVQVFSGLDSSLHSLDVHAASMRLAAGSYHGHVGIWNVEEGKLLLDFAALPGR